MGREASCTARVGGGDRAVAGKALLETRELIFRGDGLRLQIPYATIRAIEVRGEDLELRYPEGKVAFRLGAREAAAWAARIKNPPGRLDKLGVEPGMKVWLVGEAADRAFAAELRTREAQAVEGRTAAGVDLVFYWVKAPADLRRLATLRKALRPAGSLWVVRRKGAGAPVSESAVMTSGRAAGLVDTKVVAFDEVHTAERFVIPVAQR